MKKILTLLSSIGLLASSASTVISCAVGPTSYDGLFDENGEDSSNYNNDDYILPGPDDVKEQIENSLSETITADIQIRENDKEITSRSTLDSSIILQNLQTYLIEKIGLNEKDESGKTLIERGFSIVLLNDNFGLPELNGISSDGITFGDEANVVLGYGTLRLNFLGEMIQDYSFEWVVPEYEIIQSIINALHTHSHNQTMNNNRVKNIDLELFMGFTLGALPSLIGLLGINTTVNNIIQNSQKTRAGINDILGMIGPLVEPIQNLVNLDVNELAEANPDSNIGKVIYHDFDKNFRENFKKLFAALGNVVKLLGIKDEITIPGIGDQPITFKISEFLDINLLSFLPKEILEKLNLEEDLGFMSAKLKMNVKIGKKNSKGEYEITMMNILANMAPNIVLLLSKFLDKNTYSKTDNLLYLIFKELFTDMDPRLKKLIDKNSSDNESVRDAKTGIDSIVFNALVDYNKNNRNDPNKINLEIRVTLNITADFKVVKIDETPFDNSTLYEILNYVIIKPGDMVLRIINNMFDLKGETSIDLNAPFIGPNLNINFSDYISLNVYKLIEKIDLGAVLDLIKDYIVQLLEDKVQNLIKETLNTTINSALPEYSMQMVINLLPTSLVKSLLPSDFDKSILDNATITIEKAQFVFQFKQYGDNEGWYSQTTSVVGEDFNIFNTMRLHVEKMQLRVKYTSELNGEFEYLTKDNIAFNIVFSATDAKENL